MSNYIGNQLVMFLPITPYEAFTDKKKLLHLIIKCIKYGLDLGIYHVTLLGIIPCATHYGLDIVKIIRTWNDKIIVTTSHATTLACVATNCRYILNQTKRELSNEIVGVLGCGSIGYGSILTIISTFECYPRKILLCDVGKKVERVKKLKYKLENELKYCGDVDIHILISKDEETVNNLFYECSLVIGATNKANILNIDKLKPGCIICDDSAPHCFDTNKALARFKKKKDIFFLEAGYVQMPKIKGNSLQYLMIGSKKNVESIKVWSELPKDKIFSCCLGGMLLHRFPDRVEPILGTVQYEYGIQRLELFKDIGISGCAVHLPILPSHVTSAKKETFHSVLPKHAIADFVNATQQLII